MRPISAAWTVTPPPVGAAASPVTQVSLADWAASLAMAGITLV